MQSNVRVTKIKKRNPEEDFRFLKIFLTYFRKTTYNIIIAKEIAMLSLKNVKLNNWWQVWVKNYSYSLNVL